MPQRSRQGRRTRGAFPPAVVPNAGGNLPLVLRPTPPLYLDKPLPLLRPEESLGNRAYRDRTGVDSRVATAEVQDLVSRELVLQTGTRHWARDRLAPSRASATPQADRHQEIMEASAPWPASRPGSRAQPTPPERSGHVETSPGSNSRNSLEWATRLSNHYFQTTILIDDP